MASLQKLRCFVKRRAAEIINGQDKEEVEEEKVVEEEEVEDGEEPATRPVVGGRQALRSRRPDSPGRAGSHEIVQIL